MLLPSVLAAQLDGGCSLWPALSASVLSSARPGGGVCAGRHGWSGLAVAAGGRAGWYGGALGGVGWSCVCVEEEWGEAVPGLLFLELA
eukprot:2656934-Prorocentrum_lima.AAC.1